MDLIEVHAELAIDDQDRARGLLGIFGEEGNVEYHHGPAGRTFAWFRRTVPSGNLDEQVRWAVDEFMRRLTQGGIDGTMLRAFSVNSEHLVIVDGEPYRRGDHVPLAAH